MATQEFIDDSDHPSDKIPLLIQGSFSALARYGASQPRRTVKPEPHGQDFESMPDGIWSRNGTDWYPFGVTPPDTSGATPTFQTTEVDVNIDATNVNIVCSNYTALAATIFYIVEIYAKG